MCGFAAAKPPLRQQNSRRHIYTHDTQFVHESAKRETENFIPDSFPFPFPGQKLLCRPPGLSEKYTPEAFYPRGIGIIRQKNLHSRIGMNTAGMKLSTLSFVSPSMFMPSAKISTEPTHVISDTTASASSGESTCASSAIAP